jgi:hypothetical protein
MFKKEYSVLKRTPGIEVMKSPQRNGNRNTVQKLLNAYRFFWNILYKERQTITLCVISRMILYVSSDASEV